MGFLLSEECNYKKKKMLKNLLLTERMKSLDKFLKYDLGAQAQESAL